MPLYTGPHKSAAPFRNHSPLLVASDVGGAAHSSIAELPFSLNNTLTPTATYSSELEEEADHEHEPVSWSTICCGWSEHYCWYWWGAVVFGVGAVGYVVSSTLGIMGHCGTLVPCERIDLANAVIFLIHSAVCFIPWYLFEREWLPGDADYEAPEPPSDMWSDRGDSSVAGAAISYGSTMHSPVIAHAASLYFQAGDSAESFSAASTLSQYSIVSPRRLSNRLAPLHDHPPPPTPSPSTCEFALALVRISVRDYNFWAAFAFVVGSIIYIWSAVLSVRDATDPQIVWWEFAGGLVFLLDSYFYLASWHTHHAGWRPCGRGDPAVQLDWLWWGHAWFCLGSIVYATSATFTLVLPPSASTSTITGHRNSWPLDRNSRPALTVSTVADKLLSTVPWLNLGGAIIFLIDALVYGVDFWQSL